MNWGLPCEEDTLLLAHMHAPKVYMWQTGKIEAESLQRKHSKARAVGYGSPGWSLP